MPRNEPGDRFEVDREYWFVPKLFGLGATPVTWQGWVLVLGFVGLLLLDLHFMPERIARLGVGLALFLLFTVIAIRKTKGGWSWHWAARD